MRCHTATNGQCISRCVSLRTAAHHYATPSSAVQRSNLKPSLLTSLSLPGSARAQNVAHSIKHKRFTPRWRERVGRVQASWGAPVEWNTATVVDSSPATPQLQRVLLDIGVERAAGYTRAGQYVQVKVGDSKPGFFAIASPPDPNNQGVIELLIKNAGETATLLCTAAAGGEVDASPVMGKGFPIDKIPASSYSTVLMFATGSGISPIRALVESGQLQANDRAEVALYYGVKNSASAAYLDDIKQWESEGVKVVPVYSDEGKGYVQHVFEKEGVKPTDGSKVAAVLCGHKDMCTAITEILTGLGVEKDKILLNF